MKLKHCFRNESLQVPKNLKTLVLPNNIGW